MQTEKTREDETLIADLEEVSPTLADWAKDMIDRGQMDAHSIKRKLREVVEIIDRG